MPQHRCGLLDRLRVELGLDSVGVSIPSATKWAELRRVSQCAEGYPAGRRIRAVTRLHCHCDSASRVRYLALSLAFLAERDSQLLDCTLWFGRVQDQARSCGTMGQQAAEAIDSIRSRCSELVTLARPTEGRFHVFLCCRSGLRHITRLGECNAMCKHARNTMPITTSTPTQTPK